MKHPAAPGLPAMIREAREFRGIDQRELGRILHMSDSRVSDIERGLAPVPADAAPRLARRLDYPRLTIEIALAATGGAAPAWFDGAALDGHCLCRGEDAILEMAEAIGALERRRRALVAPGTPSEQALTEIEDELADAIDTAVNALARHCLKTGRSFGAVWDRQRAHNETRGYVAREPRRLARTA
jgi:transcriptional regulator with XRE-family HTH domain